MNNPWVDLPRRYPPFVLPQEYRLIRAFNDEVRTADHHIRTELLPEPYLGCPDAPVVLLGLNPGFSEHDAPFYAVPHVRAVWEKNLLHESMEFPFYLLNPGLPQGVGGPRWWRKKLNQPLKIAGDRLTASSFFCIEYFPYHSRRYRPLGTTLPSQEYSFWLLRRAMKRNALVIVTRSRKIWEEAVPELRRYPKAFALRSPQNVAISPRNCPEGWPHILKVLTSTVDDG